MRQPVRHVVVALLLTWTLDLPDATAGPVVFVDDDAPPAGDGTTWTTAFRFLRDALDNAVAGDEIRVAQGTYTPDLDEGGNVTPGDRLSTFQLLDDVAIRGGYAGLGEPDPDARDVELHETILTGDLLGNDDPDPIGSGS